jgi:hypothetical protein
MTKQNNRKTSNLIISVESRKGGVGKTTAALCLAWLLQQRHFAVLILDLDVTGTNAAHVASSPFWEKKLHIIGKDKEDTTKPESKTPINLIEMFDHDYMIGKQIPEFTSEGSSVNSLKIDLNMVNVFGSQIYYTQNDFKKERDTTIEHPGVLFDELHAYWLLDYIKQIIDNFTQFADKQNDYDNNPLKIAIVLDNSPGYVGLAPAIHDWLTDLGPVCGKFLVVTSLDTQDLLACESAVEVLHNSYKNKREISRLLLNSLRNKTEVNISKKQEPFFLRLATSIGINSRADPLSYYRYLDEEQSQKEADNRNSLLQLDPAVYIAVIVNKVPRGYKIGNDKCELSRFFKQESTIKRLLTNTNENQIAPDRMISYDEYIEKQFLLPALRGGQNTEKSIRNLIITLKKHENLLHVENQKNIDERYQLFEKDYKKNNLFTTQLSRFIEIINRARLAIENAGLDNLARLIHDEWLPGSILPEFRVALLKFLREEEIQYFDEIPSEFNTESQKRRSLDELKNHVLKELLQLMKKELNAVDKRIVNILVNSLSELISLTMPSLSRDSNFRNEIDGLLAAIIAIELLHWSKKQEQKSNPSSIQSFLAQESLEQDEIENEKIISKLVISRHFVKFSMSGFVDFYKACSCAQARLIDYAEDSQFLLQLLRSAVESEIESNVLLPFIRGLAEDVIVKKLISHQEAPSKIGKALQTADYFREFDEVLKETIKKWAVEND